MPRDHDGYVDLDAMPDSDVILEATEDWEDLPPLPPETWDAIVATAPHTDPELMGTDVDLLVVGLPDQAWEGDDDFIGGPGWAADPVGDSAGHVSDDFVSMETTGDDFPQHDAYEEPPSFDGDHQAGE